MSKYLVIGDSILDHYLYGNITRMSPEDPSVPVLDIESEEYRLGGCLNVSANLKSLSGETVYVTSIISDKCKKLLDSREINHQYSYHLVTVEGIQKTRVIDLKSGKQKIRLDNLQKFNEEFIEEYQLLLKCIDFDEFDCIVVSDYNKGIIDDFVVRKLKNYTKPVFVDTKKSDLTIWKDIPHCIVKVNWQEFIAARHRPYMGDLVVTRSEKGCQIYKDGDLVEEIGTKPVTDGDVTGAGDVFLAGFAACYMNTEKMNVAANYANIAARKSVKLRGTVEVYL